MTQRYPLDQSSFPRPSLHSDCTQCFALCCVALPFSASSDFAADKDAGQPCANLQSDFRCRIHQDLRQQGFRGCTVFDCFGAGQHVSQRIFEGRDWRLHPETAREMYEVFTIMLRLHELLWYLVEGLTMEVEEGLLHELSLKLDKTYAFTNLSVNQIMQLDLAAHQAEISQMLSLVSEQVRNQACARCAAPAPARSKYRRGADLIGARLTGADLRFTNLRGALLIAADLREADLRCCDLIGADFRDADLGGADLSDAIFLTQSQLQAAKGNAKTKLPPSLNHPEHWLIG